jgi:hypothetical protein
MTSDARRALSDSATATLAETVRDWKGAALVPHRTHAVDLHVGDRPFGRLHPTGVVDIPFPAPIREALADEGLISDARYVPSAGWITCRFGDDDVDRAAFLLRLSYLYRRIVRASTPKALERVRIELDALSVTGPVREVYDAAIEQRTRAASAGSSGPGDD